MYIIHTSYISQKQMAHGGCGCSCTVCIDSEPRCVWRCTNTVGNAALVVDNGKHSESCSFQGDYFVSVLSVAMGCGIVPTKAMAMAEGFLLRCTLHEQQ